MTRDPKYKYGTDFESLRAEMMNLPIHCPQRFETIEGFGDPTWNNSKRRGIGEALLEEFTRITTVENEIDVAASDLICDVLHFVHASGSNAQKIVGNAIDNFVAEAGSR